MYPVSVRYFFGPERGVLYILIVDNILKITLVWFTLLSASKNKFKKAPCYSWPYWVQYNTLKNMVVVILQSNLQESVIHIDFIITFVRWNKNVTLCSILYWTTMIILYFLCFILNFFVSFSFSQMWNLWFLRIFYRNFLKHSKNYINSNF